MTAIPQLATLDWVLLAVLACSVGVGLWRGIVFELMSLAAWLFAWLAAQTWGAAVAERLAHLPAAPVVGYGLCFIGSLIACALLARLLRMLISATPLRIVDRLLGASFGLLRGLLVLLVLATVVSLTPMAQSAPWQASRGAAWLGAALDTLKPLWPVGRTA